MDSDLLELLAALQGQAVRPEHETRLLRRLEQDVAFRNEVVLLLQLMGQLKAVNSPAPRWPELEALLGENPRARLSDVELEKKVLHRIKRLPRRTAPVHNPWLAWSIAALLALVVGLVWKLSPPAATGNPVEKASAQDIISTVTLAEAVVWDKDQTNPPLAGDAVYAGKYRLQNGYLTLAFVNGVELFVEGPANFEVESASLVQCSSGKMRAHVPKGAEGFQITGPGVNVLDLGTEFGLNVEENGKAKVMVFEGQIEVSVLTKKGEKLRTEKMLKDASVEVDSNVGQIRKLALDSNQFARRKERLLPSLKIDKAYVEAIQAANPWGYWRFESFQGRTIPNEISGRPTLSKNGETNLLPMPGGNRCLEFKRANYLQNAVLDEPWTLSPGGNFAVECWVLFKSAHESTVLSAGNPSLFQLDTISTNKQNQLTNLRFIYNPTGAVGAAGGSKTILTSLNAAPFEWHHVVLQKTDKTLMLFVDGELARANTNSEIAESSLSLMLGGIPMQPPHRANSALPVSPDKKLARSFAGGVDELALYPRALSEAEVREHYQLVRPTKPGE